MNSFIFGYLTGRVLLPIILVNSRLLLLVNSHAIEQILVELRVERQDKYTVSYI